MSRVCLIIRLYKEDEKKHGYNRKIPYNGGPHTVIYHILEPNFKRYFK